jgi:hypothetical protein
MVFYKVPMIGDFIDVFRSPPQELQQSHATGAVA